MSDPLVVILDDHADFRESTAWLVESFGPVVEHVEDPLAAIELLADVPMQRPCMLLLDIRMPVMSGLEVHEELRSRAIAVPVIYMTAHGDVPLAVNAMRKGALTFLEKPLNVELLRTSVMQALGKHAQRRRIAEHERLLFRSAPENIQRLTPRESQVLDCILGDKTNKEIARHFDISLKTVEMHRSRLMHKLGARSAAQLVRLVMSHAAG